MKLSVMLSRKVGAPVLVQWTREDDIRHSYYHTTSVEQIDVALDADNKVTGWRHNSVAPTILSTFVPGFSEASKYAIVAGAVSGGGLTVIANAPNPAGQAILKKRFEGGVSPLHLMLGALAPTLIALAIFVVTR